MWLFMEALVFHLSSSFVGKIHRCRKFVFRECSHIMSARFSDFCPPPPSFQHMSATGSPRHAYRRFYPRTLLCPYAPFHHKSFTNLQPRTLHRAGKYQIELVNKTRKNAEKIYVGVAIFTMAGARAW